MRNVLILVLLLSFSFFTVSPMHSLIPVNLYDCTFPDPFGGTDTVSITGSNDVGALGWCREKCQLAWANSPWSTEAIISYCQEARVVKTVQGLS